MRDRAYISIVQWPQGFSKEHRVRALMDALGIDIYDASLRAVPEPPQVYARVEADLAANVLARFRAHKVTAFAVTHSSLRAQPAPVLVKRLVPAMGAAEPMYMVEPWRGEPQGLRMADVFLIVRAALNQSKHTYDARPSVAFGWKIAAPEYALIKSAIDGPLVERTTTLKFTYIIDVYMNDGRRFRFNSDRISYDVLGNDRSYTDRENSDRLALRLATEAPQALIDVGFERFRVPAEFSRDMVSVFSSRVTYQRDQTAVFDFYSVWMHALHQGMAALHP